MNEVSRMDWATSALLAATLLLLSLGQILFKLASADLSLKEPRSFASPSLLAALAIYGIATVMWVLVLKKMPLSVAFPFYGFTFLLVPGLAYLILGEKIAYQTLIGGAIILLGIFVANWRRVG